MDRVTWQWGLCGLAIAAIAGCAIEPGAAPASAARGTAAAGTCTTAAANGPWINQAFASQTGRFHAEVDVTPSAAGVDAVVALGAGPAANFNQIAAIARFSPAGVIDARDGAGYRADVVQPYTAGTTYHLRFDVDVRSHTYSLWLRTAWGSYTALARNYLFRTQQATVPALNNFAAKADNAVGSITACGLTIVTDATTADGCIVAAAGDGFASVPIADASVLASLTFTATASATGIDGVIGVSAGPPTSFASLAAAVRFNPASTIDVYDRTGYRADQTWSYAAGAARSFQLLADVTSRSYSTWLLAGGDAFELARQYGFRTTLAGIGHVDTLSLIVDTPTGVLTVCGLASRRSTGVAYSREGTYAVAGLPGNHALIATATSTTRVDAAGQPVATVARGGEVAVDGAGNAAIASVAGGVALIDAYDPALAPRWRTGFATAPAGTLAALAFTSAGELLIAVRDANTGIVWVYRIAADGTQLDFYSVTAQAIAFDDAAAFAVAVDAAGVHVKRLVAGAVAWERVFAGSASISAVTATPAHGVVLGGVLSTPIDFGGGALPTRTGENGPYNAFVVALDAAGAHAFSRRTESWSLDGVAATATRVLVSTTERTQFFYPHLYAYSPTGAALPATFDLATSGWGQAGRIAVSPAGRVWWGATVGWQPRSLWPYLFALDL